MANKAVENILEKLIDENGLTNLVELIAQICFEKASHIRESYQDSEPPAKTWQRNGNRISNLATKIES